MKKHVYKGARTNEISFPLGGIGAGCMGLAGNGRLIDWEIFNKPNKGSLNGLSHFAVKAEKDGKLIDARVLQGDLHPPYSGEFGQPTFNGFGWGSKRQNLCGMPHFRKHSFKGEYPFAEISFGGEKFPGGVTLVAWSPFIPSNDKDSSLPGAFFEIEFSNDTADVLDYTAVCALSNPFGQDNSVDKFSHDSGISQLLLTNSGIPADSTEYGEICISTDTGELSFQEYWFRGTWCDDFETYWRDFIRPGKFKNRSYASGKQKSWEGKDTGHIAAHIRIEPGKTGKVRFAITWNIPNCKNYWNQGANERATKAGIPLQWKNWYATQWSSAQESGKYSMLNWNRLAKETKLFHGLLFRSSLPEVAIEAITATMSVLKTPTCLRLEDGTFYGWEGTGCCGGCCEGSCTHVWNYQQALAFLFPSLERSMRSANYRFSVDEDGGSHFRIQLPLGVKATTEDFRPCADGQFGDIIKTYRDWKISGDTEWLKKLWPAMRKTIEYAWNKNNPDKWDPGRTGVLHGRQHHTLDMELFGPSSWLTGFYLAALKAGAEMAEHLGDKDFASELRSLFAKGKKWSDDNLFNGEYYCQKIDLNDKGFLESFEGCDKHSMVGGLMETYWSEEHKEIKYQIGEGIEIDAVLPQWHANLYGLGEILDPEKTRKTLEANYKYNFKKSMREEYNPWRIFALNEEASTVICAWPENRRRPAIPLPYSQEAMNGFEYAAGIHMIQNGMIDKGMEIVKAVRDRYNGENRNPWNEIECGSNYARNMATYALLNTFSGFRFDMTRSLIGFHPIADANDFRCFWALDGAWGEVVFTEKGAELKVAYGSLELKILDMPFKPSSISSGKKELGFAVKNGLVELAEPIKLKAGKSLTILK